MSNLCLRYAPIGSILLMLICTMKSGERLGKRGSDNGYRLMNYVGSKKRLAKVTQSVLITLVEDIRLLYYAYFFVSIVLVFALAYYLLTPMANGIAVQGALGAELTFMDATYFSVVTISSLGYGDMQPVGLARYLAGCEVLIGLTLMGIMLAKLTSFRLSYHVARLYGSEMHKRLEEFSSDFVKSEQRLRTVMLVLGEIFRETPGKALEQPDADSLLQFSGVLTKLKSRASDLCEFVKEESGQGAFFSNAPRSSLDRAIENLQEALSVLNLLISSLPSRGRAVILDRDNRNRTIELKTELLSLCDTVKENSTDMHILSRFARFRVVCEAIPEQLFTTPVIISDQEQPDQIFDEGDVPQDE